ncbi:MAG: NAD-dependent succinate-semialdehyde dehydrogenase [Myxococcota bacterium]
MTRATSLMFIGGEWCRSATAGMVGVEDPATGQTVGEVAAAAEADVRKALDAAASGFARWRGTSSTQRQATLRRIADEIDARRDSLAIATTREQGKPIGESYGELERTADAFRWCADEATRIYGRVLTPRGRGHREMLLREPIGPVAGFSPWNFPAVMTGRKIAAALAAGCSIVIKPSEEAPAVSVGLIKACEAAGVPAGAVNLLFYPPAEIANQLIASPVIQKVSLTGSVRVGRTLSALAGQHLKPVTMELGGHAPVVVFDDADVDAAARLTSAFKFRNAGQVCLGVGRVLVQANVFKRFLESFVGEVERIRVGPGGDPATTMGPLASRRQLEATQSFVEDAVTRGAHVVCGGKRVGDVGYFFEPTVLTEVPMGSRILTEEPFGPVVPIIPFETYGDAVEKANRTDYGLAAYAFTTSLERATHIAEDLEAGWVGINGFMPALAEAPFGGYKLSGIGAEGGPEGLLAYTRQKFVSQKS